MKKSLTALALLLNSLCFSQVSSVTDDISLIPAADKEISPLEHWGYINQKGAWVIPPQFKDAYYFREELAPVDSGGVYRDLYKFGFIDKTGKYVIPPKYISVTHFSNGLAFVVPKGGSPTCIDKQGNPQFSLKKIRKVSIFVEDMAVFLAADSEKWGYLNSSGKVTIPAQFEEADLFSEGLALVKKNGKWGYINKKGVMVIKPQFERASYFQEGMAVAQDTNGGLYGYIDHTGKYVIKPQFKKARVFNEGLAVVFFDNNQSCLIDVTGKRVIEKQPYEIDNFSSNMVGFMTKDSLYGYINKKGEEVIKPQFQWISYFLGDIAFADIGEDTGIIDKKGQFIVTPTTYKDIKIPGEFYMVATDDYDATKFLDKFFNDLKSMASSKRVTDKPQELTSTLSVEKVEREKNANVYHINFKKTGLLTGTSIVNQMKELLKRKFKAKESKDSKANYEIFSTQNLHFVFFADFFNVIVWVAPSKEDFKATTIGWWYY